MVVSPDGNALAIVSRTGWEALVARSETRRQHQPPCQAPWTSTKVF
jgi:hypothetical protein